MGDPHIPSSGAVLGITPHFLGFRVTDIPKGGISVPGGSVFLVLPLLQMRPEGTPHREAMGRPRWASLADCGAAPAGVFPAVIGGSPETPLYQVKSWSKAPPRQKEDRGKKEEFPGKGNRRGERGREWGAGT